MRCPPACGRGSRRASSLVVGRVNAGDANLLYEGVRRLPWEDVIAPGASMAVTAHGMNEELRNTRFTALKVKDGVCDRLREARGERPDVDAASADATVDVRIREDAPPSRSTCRANRCTTAPTSRPTTAPTRR